jgi:hypothetical protein
MIRRDLNEEEPLLQAVSARPPNTDFMRTAHVDPFQKRRPEKADRIAAFRSELAIVENEQVLTLSEGQRAALADYHT